MGGVKCGIIRRTKPSEGRMRELKVEAWLTANGIPEDTGQPGACWKYVESVPLTEIAFPSSNPGRLGLRIDQERVKDYAAKLENGAKFPAVVLLVVPNGRHEPISGEHRLGGIALTSKKIAKETSAYLVREPDEYRKDVLIRMINTIEGVAPPKNEIYQQAVELVIQHNKPVGTIAREHCLEGKTLKTKVHAALANKRAIGMGHLLSNAEGGGIAAALHSIKMDRPFENACRFVIGNRPQLSTVLQMVQEVNSQISEQAQLDIIKQYNKDEVDDRKRTKVMQGSVSLGSYKNLARVQKSYLRWTENVVNLHLGLLSQRERDALNIRNEAIKKKIAEIEEELIRIKLEEKAA
jgi:hypothetical protein